MKKKTYNDDDLINAAERGDISWKSLALTALEYMKKNRSVEEMAKNEYILELDPEYEEE